MGSSDRFKKCQGSSHKKNFVEAIMLQTVKAYYYNGKIELEEGIRTKKKVPVLVTFLKEDRGNHLSASPHASSSKNLLHT